MRWISLSLGAIVFAWANVGFSQQAAQPQQAAQAPQSQQPPQAPQAPQTPQTPQTPQAPPPAQTQPVQSVYVQPPAGSTSTSAAGTTATTSAMYGAGGDVRAEKKTEHLPNKALLTTGITLFVAAYVPSFAVGGASPRDEDRALFVPGVGPWIDLGNRSCTSCGNSESVSKALIATSGILQDAGVILGVVSFFAPETERTTFKRDVSSNVSWKIVPMSYGGGGGVGAVGRF